MAAVLLMGLAHPAAAGPAVSFSPGSLDFGDQPVGSTSGVRSITATNTGDAQLLIISVVNMGGHIGEFNGVQDCTVAPIAPGQSCSFSVRFSPGAPGPRGTTLTVYSSAPGSPHAIALSGNGTPAAAPSLELSASNLSFSSQSVGTTSAEQTITLSNSGTAPLQITGVGAGGTHPGDFSVNQNCGAPLSPGGTCTITVRFTPTAPGSRSGLLSISSNVPGSPHTVSLSGTGAPLPAPSLSVTPASLNFGSQAVGTSSPGQSVTLTNSGTAPLSIQSVTLGGAQPGSFSITGGSESGVLAANGSRTVSVVFSPTASGTQSASLAVHSTAGGSPHTIALTGTGLASAAPGFSVSPASLTFARQEVGTRSAPQSVVISNPGEAPLVISSVSLTSGSYEVAGGTATVAPGGTHTLSVTFAPSSPGSRNGTLVIRHNAGSGTSSVPLVGTAINPPEPPDGKPAANLRPSLLEFGDQPLGEASPPQTVLIASTGTAPLLIRSITLAGSHRREFEIVAGGQEGTLAEALTRSVTVRFTPTGAGTRTATLEVRTNATGSPHRVNLSGVGLITAATGDWPVFMHDPRQLGRAEAVLDPRSLSPWSVPLDGRPGASPVVRRGVAYIGTETGLFAIDLVTRAQRWRRLLPMPVRSAPAAASAAVVVSAGALYGLNPADGSVLWERKDIAAHPDVSPMLVEDVVYLAAPSSIGDGTALYAVQAASGVDHWPTPVRLPAGYECGTTVAAYPEFGLLFVGLTPSAGATGPAALPAAVMALRLADGGAAWAAPTLLPPRMEPVGMAVGWVSSTPSLAVPQAALFLNGGAGILALNAVTGSLLWTRALPDADLRGSPVLSTAAPAAATLYLADARGRIHALASTTGATVPGGLTLPNPVTGALALADTTLYVPTAAALVGVDVTTGKAIWSSPLGAASGVAVAGGAPHVATADGRLVGFGK
jgi:outer membrane protein assembly factor BamB